MRPDRAVIDIGSNTVRLVIYTGNPRAPLTWLNEKVSARLGRDLAATGRMPEKAMKQALAALQRYETILRMLNVSDVETVATAAVRDAGNGDEFLGRVRALGLSPRLLSGEEEAQASAFGVIGAFPGANGTVADLGGGSLELIMIDDGTCHDGVSLPLGTLRLPALRRSGPDVFRDGIMREMEKVHWAAAHPGPLYMVGGTWRALAAFALHGSGHPLSDPHGYSLSADEAGAVARQVAKTDPAELAPIPGISSSRAPGLPNAAALLRVMLAELQPESVVFSAWGLREGLLFQRLGTEQRSLDPLIAGVAEFAAPRGGDPDVARAIAAWISNAVGGDERLRLSSAMLSLAAVHIEPNLRARHAYEWPIEKRWIGLDPRGRAWIAAALLAAAGKVVPPPELERMSPGAALREATASGLAFRLGRRLSAGSVAILGSSSLCRDGSKLVLKISADLAHLANDKVAYDLETLADWLALEPVLQVESSEIPRPLEGNIMTAS